MTSEKGPKLPTELISPAGDLYATARTDLPPLDDRTERVGEIEVDFKCGHRGRTFHAVIVHGDLIYLDAQQIHDREECADCVIRRNIDSSIRCAICGRLIRDGQIVALYRMGEGFRDDAMHVTNKDADCVIGCHECLPNPAFLCGVWVEKKFTPAAILIDPFSGAMIAVPEEFADQVRRIRSGRKGDHRLS